MDCGVELGKTAQRKSAPEAATCLTNKAPHLDHPTTLAKGRPIATGAIESARRHLVKDRLEIGGARWDLDTAQAVLTLRAIVTNDDFDDYRQHHQQQKHHRTYPATTSRRNSPTSGVATFAGIRPFTADPRGADADRHNRTGPDR
jgi:hypothetical protein